MWYYLERRLKIAKQHFVTLHFYTVMGEIQHIKFKKNVSIYQVSPSFIVLFQKILSFTSIVALILLSYNKILGTIFVVVVLNDLLISIKLRSSRNLKKKF